MQRARACSLHAVETIGAENIIAARVLLPPNAAGMALETQLAEVEDAYILHGQHAIASQSNAHLL